MRTRRITLAAALATAFLLPTTGVAQADGHVPEDCAVPPFIDLSQYNIIIGTDESETLRGTAGPDFICARLGDDRIVARGGGDLILGDNTTFFGNKDAEGGDDLIFAGRGPDQVLSGPGDDTVLGGRGHDFLALAVGDDRGVGGHGHDNIIGGFGWDVILGERGDDMLAGGPDRDLILGGPGDDFMAGQLPPSDEPPPVPVPDAFDRCFGARGVDTAVDCDRTRSVEN